MPAQGGGEMARKPWPELKELMGLSLRQLEGLAPWVAKQCPARWGLAYQAAMIEKRRPEAVALPLGNQSTLFEEVDS